MIITVDLSASLIMLASVAAREPFYIATPCRNVDESRTVSTAMRNDDNIVNLTGSTLVRKAFALGYRRVWINDKLHLEADQHVRRASAGALIPLEQERRCSVEIVGPP